MAEVIVQRLEYEGYPTESSKILCSPCMCAD